MRAMFARLALVASFSCMPMPTLASQDVTTRASRPDDEETLRRVEAEALSLAKEQGGERAPGNLANLAEFLAKCGDREGARELFREAVQLAGTHERSSVTSQLGTKVRVRKADPSAYVYVGSLQARNGFSDDAQVTFRLALSHLPQVAEANARMALFSSLASEFGKLKSAEDLDVIGQLAGTELDSHTKPGLALSYLAGVYVSLGDGPGVLRVIGRIEEMSPVGPARDLAVGQALEKAMDAIERRDPGIPPDLLEYAYERLERIPSPEDRHRAMTALARGMARYGDIPTALERARECISGHGAKDDIARMDHVQMLSEIARAQIVKGDVEGGRATLGEAYEIARAGDPSPARSGRLGTVVMGYIEAKDTTGARLALAAMRRGRRAQWLLLLGTSLSECGEVVAARAAFRDALEDAKSERGTKPIAGIDHDGLGPEPASWNDLIEHEIAWAQARLGDFDAAIATNDRMTGAFPPAWTAAQIAQAQAASGQATEALLWVKKIAKEKGYELPDLAQAVLAGIHESGTRHQNGKP